MEVVSSNVNQVQIPQTQAPPRPFGAAQEIPAEFLALRQLNKHAHLRVSPYPLDSKAFQGPVSLFAASASKACFATVIRTADPASGQQFAIALGSLANLRQALSQGTAEDNLIPFTPQKTFDCGTEKPVILKFAANDERLVVGFEQGPVLVFDVNAFVNSNDRPTPMVFQSDASGYPRSIHPNPGDHPELVAVLRGIYGQDRGLYVEVLDVINHKIVGGWFSSTSIDAMPVSVSWSPRGKQIAIGTHSGDILLYTPQDTSMLALKGHIPRPSDPALTGCCAFSITWLANPTFHVIYANPRAVARWDVENEDHPEYHHRIVVHDKATPGELALSDNPCSPFGARRLPNPTNVVLKNWGKIKFLIFAGDGPSSDVGAIGCIDDKWGLLALDETSRAALPLTADMDESALFGLELDLTSPDAIKGEQPDDDSLLPPAPILCAYTSEGWLVAWHVIAQREGQYPGLTTAPGSSQMSTKPLTPPTTINTQPPAPAFGSPAQQTSPFGAAAAKTPSPFGTPQPVGSFGSPSATPAFGSTGFGAAGAPPTFGSTGFGSAPAPAAPASGSAFGGGGFSAFANKTSAFGAPASSSTPSPFAAASAKAGEAKPASTFAPTPPAAPTFGNTSTPAAPTFGSTSTPAAPTFGQSSFGFGKPAAPAFGQTGFGFGQPGAAAAAPAAPAAGGGFGAFANKPSAFGSGPTPPSTAEPAKATPAAPASSGPFSAFAGQPSAFGAAAADAAKPAQASGGFGALANKTVSFGSGSGASDAAAGPFSPFANKTPAFTAPSPSVEPAKPAAEAPKPATQPTPAFGQTAFSQPKAPAPASTKPPALRSESPPSSDDEAPKPSASSVSLASFVKPSAAFGAFGKAQDSAANKDAKPSPFALAASGGNVLGQATVATAGFGQPSAFGSLGLGRPPGAGATPGTAFGQTSALGFGKPPAAAKDKAKETVSTPIAGGGFSAFSNTGGFSAFAGGRTASFGGAAKDSSAQDEAAKKVFGDTKPSTSSEGSGKDASTKDEAAKAFRDTQPLTSPGDTAKDSLAEEATVTGDTKPATLFSGKKNLRKATPAEEDVGSDLGALKLSLDDKDASTTPDASPAKPANPHGSAFSTPAKSVFPAPAPSTTPAETPSKEASAPASSPFGSFAESSSPFGSFSTKDGTTIANAFAPQSPATTTPRKDDAAASTTPSATPSAEPIFGKSSFFGTNPLFGQTPASSPAPVSAFAAFAGKPSVFGPPPTKDDVADKDASSSTPTKSPSLLDRMGPPPVPSLLSRMGPPPPVRIEPLPPDSDEGEEEAGDEDEEDEEGELHEGEDGEEEFDSEEEYEVEDGEEEEDEEEEEDDEEDPADSPTKGKDKAKAKSEDPPATSSIFNVPEITTTKPEPVRAVSEPASPFSKQVQPTESTPAKPSLFGLGRPGLGGAPARSSPLASNPPVTASENDGRGAAAPPKPALVLPGPAVTPFPGFTDSAKKPMPTFSGFPAAQPPATPTPATPLGAGKFSPAPFPAKPSPVPALFGENRSATPPAGFSPAGPKPLFPSSPGQSPLATPQAPPSIRPTSQVDPPATPVPAETPLQQQFAEIYIQMTRDLEQLGVDARKLAQQQAELSQPRGGRTPVDLRTPEKWGPGDLVAFQQVIRNFEKEAMGLKDHSLEVARMFADLQSLLLQAEVKKEEMVRYARANKDPEFKRMINVRGLGPEQEESQTKLRKQIQAVGDRVQQLEDVIDSLQRKLEAHNSGRYRIEAPTLDTINRTCRNIDIALEQRASEISRLANRVAQLRLSNSAAPANPASTSNAEKKHARAASIAHAKAADAALSAEHSAERLKNILSRARTEPILSVVSSAPPVKHISQHTQPASAATPAKTPPMPTAGGSPGGFFNFAPGATLPKTPPKFDWTPPQAQAESPAESDDGSPLGDRRGGSRRQTRHSGSVKFEKKESTSSSQVVPFDWGPLPEFAAGKK